MVKDVVSNFIIKLKNAGVAGKSEVSFPYSKFIESVIIVLKETGYVKSFSTKGKKIVKNLDIELAFNDDKTPRISHVKRISKLSKRIYKGKNDLHPIRNNYGHLIVSTSKGVMTSFDAKKQNVGGEALFEIW